jgi:hypothetical protein
MHGGTNPGAPKGQANGAYKSGLYTAEALSLRKQLRDIMRDWKAFEAG